MTTTAGQWPLQAHDETHLATSAYDAAILAAIDDAIVATNREDRITRWSPSAKHLFGYSSAEAIGQPVAVLVPPELDEERARLLGRLRGGKGTGRVEITSRHKDGQLIDVSLSVAPIIDADGQFMGAAAIVRDISARKRAERALEARAHQQAALAELGQHALAGTDLAMLMDEAVSLVARTLDVEYCSVLELLPEENGLSLRSNVGWGPHRTGMLVGLGPESQAGFTLGQGAPVIYEDLTTETRFHAPSLFYEHRVVSGISVAIPGLARPFGILGAQTTQRRAFTVDDAHFLEAVANVLAAAIERHETEARLREREAQYRSMFEATTEGVGIYDVNGVLVEVNRACCLILGYSREEMIGHQVAEFIHPDDHHVVEEFRASIRATGTARAQIVDVRKDGTLVPVDVHATAFVYNGRPHVLGMLRDVTEEVQAYELLEKRVAERTRELSTLLDVSHTVASTLELEPLLGLILAQLKTVVDYTAASIFIVEGEHVRVLDYCGPLPREQVLDLRVPLAHAVGYQAVLHHDGPVILDDLWDRSPLALAFQGLPGHLKATFAYARSVMVLPLKVKERLIGVVRIDHSEARAYAERHAALVVAIANQAAVAIENARLYAHAQEVAAQEERHRLARELHDSVSQALYGVTMYAEAAATLLAGGERETATTYLREVRATSQEALQEMRLLIFELRPPILAQEGLVAALQARVAAVEGRVAGLEANLEAEGIDRLPEAVEGALYGIALETLNNVFKHARAHTVMLALRQEGRTVTLDIADDGVGFDPATVRGRGGLGLGGMAERAAQVSARLTVESTLGQGTRVRVEVGA